MKVLSELPLTVLATLALSLACIAAAPAAFVCLAMANRAFPSVVGRRAFQALTLLTVIFVVNLGTVIVYGLLGLSDQRPLFVGMLIVLLSSAGMTWNILAMAAEVVGRPWGQRQFQWFCLGSGLAAVAGVVLSVFDVTTGASRVEVTGGFLAATVVTSFGAAFAGLRVWASRDALAGSLKGVILLGSAAGFVVGIASVAGDVARAAGGGPSFPFSPVALLFFSVITIVEVSRRFPRLVPTQPTPQLPTGLTEREQEVFSRWMKGESREQIAAALFVSPHTVKNHIHAIYQKTGFSSRWELLQRYGGGLDRLD